VNLLDRPSDRIDPDADFKPNGINTLVYTAGFVLQANVFAVNYRGYPFMTSFFANKRFSRMIFFMWGFAFLLASGFAPEILLNFFELVQLPNIHMPLSIILIIDTVLAFFWERVVVRGILGG